MNRPSLSFRPCLIAASLTAAFSGNAIAVDYVWTGGNFIPGTTAPSPLVAPDTLSLNAGTDKIFNAVGFINQSTVTWKANDIGFVDSVVTNAGLWDAKGNDALKYTSGSPSQFTNSGIFRKSGGSANTTIGSNLVFINSGTLEAQTGTIDFAGGSAYFNAGTQFTGGGINRVSNHATFSGTFTSANLVLAGGNFYGNNSAPAVLNGTADWSGGQFVGSWQVAGGQTLAVKSGSAKNFNATNFVNNGTVTWGAGNDIGFVDSVVTNAGLWDAKGNDALKYTSGSPSQFTNSGIFRKSGGSGTTSIGSNVVFINSGVVDVMIGTIRLPDNFLNPGTITGGGTVQTNVLTNNGHIAPGNGVGTLTLAGSFVQGGAGVLDIQLGELGGHDLLTVTGAASLNGGLALSCFGGCYFAVGSEITILDSVGDLSGSFAGALTLSGFATGAFNVVYDYDHDLVKLVAIEDVTPVPEPETWAMLLVGLGVVSFAARRRRVQER